MTYTGDMIALKLNLPVVTDQDDYDMPSGEAGMGMSSDHDEAMEEVLASHGQSGMLRQQPRSYYTAKLTSKIKMTQ